MSDEVGNRSMFVKEIVKVVILVYEKLSLFLLEILLVGDYRSFFLFVI